MSSWIEPDLFAVLLLGLAVPLLGLIALLARSARVRRPWWALAALGAAAFAAAAYVAGQPQAYWLPPTVLAALFGAFQAVRSHRLVRAAAALLALLRRPVVQGALLVVLGPTLAAGWVVWDMCGVFDLQVRATPALVRQTPQLQASPSLRAATDAHRPLTVYQLAGAPASSDQLMEADTAVISGDGAAPSLIRTAPPSQAYNCHGWVFTGGRGWIEGTEVEQILQDNAYYPVAKPRAGDLVIYRDASGAISHSGVVQRAWAGNVPVIESKWGEGGRYLSAANATPYGAPTYYHTSRRGHLLHGLGDERTAGLTLQ